MKSMCLTVLQGDFWSRAWRGRLLHVLHVLRELLNAIAEHHHRIRKSARVLREVGGVACQASSTSVEPRRVSRPR